MDRNSERGQMMIEMILIALLFTGFFTLAVSIAEKGERAQTQFRFQRAHR